MELNFKKLGTEGPEIVILHGLFGMLDNWKTFGRHLSEQYQVYLVDQRDHGRSPRTSDFNYKLLAGCLLYTSPSPRDRTRSRMPSSA